MIRPGKIDPSAYHVADAIVKKYTGTLFLDKKPATQDIVDKMNQELKAELIKREIPENMVEIILEEGYGVAESKFSIKFGAANPTGRGNAHVTLYEDWAKG